MKVSEAFKRAFRGEDVDDPEADEPSIANLLLITQDGCHGCEMAKEYLVEELDSGAIKECPLSDSKCAAIADKLHLRETPSIVSIDSHGAHHKCDIRTDGDDFMFECPMSDNDTEKRAEEAIPPKHGKVGKRGIVCMSPEVKNQLGYFLQSQPNLADDILPLLGSLPACSDAEDGMPTSIGFGELKNSSGVKTKPASNRGAFMRECLSGKTGIPQSVRMSECSKRWREMSDKEKKRYG